VINIKQRKILSKEKKFTFSHMNLIMHRDRRPSYTDRILVSKLSKDLQIVKYSSIHNIKLSDHRPVFADIILQIAFIDGRFT
jgi:endonuclease/exonuclease/phosphatase family metal-dependent hydrolase